MSRRAQSRPRRPAAAAEPGAGPAGAATGADAVAPRQPCPCGSGKRYKNCHGGGDVAVARPFEGLAAECEWIALREVVPSATAALRLADPALAGRDVTLATVLPLALPAIVRADGRILLGLQVHARSGDVSRDLAHALEQALAAEPGSMLPSGGLPGPGARLQDLLDPAAPLVPTVHADFGFWLAGGGDDPDGDPVSDNVEVRASLERANAAVVPTARLAGVDAAYWCQAGSKAHLRWVLPQDEDPLMDALARLAADGALGLGEGTRYAGSFRAHGRLVPVWDLPPAAPAEDWAQPAADFAQRLAAALAAPGPLPDAARRARDGLRGRQLTLR
jgi:Family of unknown function (DUF5926)/SEC-C motif